MGEAVEAPATIVFTLFYVVFSLGFAYQSKEFVGAGLSPENILSFRDWIGSEELRFVDYHIRRTAGTLLLNSFLPLGYLMGYSYFTSVVDGNHPSMWTFWEYWPVFRAILGVAALLPLGVLSLVWYWQATGWESHPFVRKLNLYAGGNWRHLAADLDTEFRRIDKIRINTSPLERLVVTDSWIVRLGCWPWGLAISHQSDSSLKIITCDTHRISTEGEPGGAQFLLIEVVSRKAGVSSFRFRVNALEYQNLQDRLAGPIQNVRNIQIYRTVSDRFVDVFKEQVAGNPRASAAAATEELEACIGCMAVTANVRLRRICENRVVEGEEPCVNCYCRPMWCVDCLAKWFASRQDQNRPETWLASKCPCPTCRSKFCVLDVALIE